MTARDALRNMGKGLAEFGNLPLFWAAPEALLATPPRTVPVWKLKAIAQRNPADSVDVALRKTLTKLLALVDEEERR